MEKVKKDIATQLKLINQALNAAVSSVNLAKELLVEVNHLKGPVENQNVESRLEDRDLPGVVGSFDGQAMVSEDGQKFQIPENYASKSMLVFGDKLKMIEVNGEKRFKQIERVKRQKASGLVVKKEGRLHVVTSDGSYRVLPAALSHFGGNEGDEAQIVIPLVNRHVPFAAVEGVTVKGSEGQKVVESAPASAEVPAMKVPEKKPAPEKKGILERIVKATHPAKKTEKTSGPVNHVKVTVEKKVPDSVEIKAKREEAEPLKVEEKKTDNSSLIGEDELR